MNKVFFHLGNLFIILSLIGFVFLFYPIFQMYVTPPTVQKVTAKKGIYITIPKIHAQSPIVLNVDPWNQNVYDEALKKGVAQAKGTALPGEQGTTFLFAHSSGAPWDMNRYNTIFYRLGELNNGDIITITKDGKQAQYKVVDKKEVDPSDVSYLSQNQKTQIILQTCTPIGTSLRRLLIFAIPA